jgi:hypothetical protein
VRAPPQSLHRILLTLCARAHVSHPVDLTRADWRLLTRAFEKHSTLSSFNTAGGLWHAAYQRDELRAAMVASTNAAIRDLAARYASAEALAAIEAVMNTTLPLPDTVMGPESGQ